MYKVEITPLAIKQLRKLPKDIARRLLKKIDGLSEDPRPTGCKKLKCSDPLYRLRQGDWRVIYRVEDRNLLVLVVKVGNRREIY